MSGFETLAQVSAILLLHREEGRPAARVSLRGVNDAEALFPVQPLLEGTSFPVPTAPGLGIEIDEKLAESQTWKFWEAPHWKRRDGSVQNW